VSFSALPEQEGDPD
jgi:hypothetical protein